MASPTYRAPLYTGIAMLTRKFLSELGHVYAPPCTVDRRQVVTAEYSL